MGIMQINEAEVKRDEAVVHCTVLCDLTSFCMVQQQLEVLFLQPTRRRKKKRTTHGKSKRDNLRCVVKYFRKSKP
jgi:hypothetical protein